MGLFVFFFMKKYRICFKTKRKSKIFLWKEAAQRPSSVKTRIQTRNAVLLKKKSEGRWDVQKSCLSFRVSGKTGHRVLHGTLSWLRSPQFTRNSETLVNSQDSTNKAQDDETMMLCWKVWGCFCPQRGKKKTTTTTEASVLYKTWDFKKELQGNWQ